LSIASKTFGVPLESLNEIAYAESGMNPYARNPMGSAGGLFQFVDGTWNSMLKKYGNAYGIPANASKFNPFYNAMMGAALYRDSYNTIKGVRPHANTTDVYMAHFLGGDGAVKFFNALDKTKGAGIAANYVGADQVKSNPSVFTINGKPATLAGLYDTMAKKLGHKGSYPNIPYTGDIADANGGAIGGEGSATGLAIGELFKLGEVLDRLSAKPTTNAKDVAKKASSPVALDKSIKASDKNSASGGATVTPKMDGNAIKFNPEIVTATGSSDTTSDASKTPTFTKLKNKLTDTDTPLTASKTPTATKLKNKLTDTDTPSDASKVNFNDKFTTAYSNGKSVSTPDGTNPIDLIASNSSEQVKLLKDQNILLKEILGVSKVNGHAMRSAGKTYPKDTTAHKHKHVKEESEEISKSVQVNIPPEISSLMGGAFKSTASA
jgi:hypothetical protein